MKTITEIATQTMRAHAKTDAHLSLALEHLHQEEHAQACHNIRVAIAHAQETVRQANLLLSLCEILTEA